MFRIVSNQFGYPMYASSASEGWSDQVDEAHLFDQNDNRDIKLGFWRAVAGRCGFNPDAVQIVEA